MHSIFRVGAGSHARPVKRAGTGARPYIFLAALLLFSACTGDLNEAEKFRNQGRYRSALESYLFFAKAHPRHSKVPYALLESGKIYLMHLHEPGKAIFVLKQLVANFAKSKYTLEAQRMIADIAKDHLADYRQAIVEYQRLIDIAPNSSDNDEYQLQIANCYTFLNEHRQARIEYQAMLKNHPTSPLATNAIYGIANSYYIQGQYEQAINYYQKLLEQNPEQKMLTNVRFGLASCYEEIDELDKALQLYTAIEKDYPTPQVIQIRTERIKRRIDKRSRKDEKKDEEAQ